MVGHGTALEGGQLKGFFDLQAGILAALSKAQPGAGKGQSSDTQVQQSCKVEVWLHMFHAAAAWRCVLAYVGCAELLCDSGALHWQQAHARNEESVRVQMPSVSAATCPQC